MLRTQQIRLPAAAGSERGLLVFDGETLLAVLAFLDGAFYERDQGKWHVEASLAEAVRAGEVMDDVTEWLRSLEGAISSGS